MVRNQLNKLANEPYLVFFFFGWLMGLTFIGIWPLNIFFGIGEYPGIIHTQGIISLFIGSFAMGFLLTALPRFTGTKSAGPLTVWGIFAVSIIELEALFTRTLPLARLALALKFLAVIVFAFRRFRKKELPLPPSFIWVGFALFSIFSSGLGLYFTSRYWIDPSWTPVFLNLLYRGLLTGLFMGIGGRLVPILTGIAKNTILQSKSWLSSERNETLLHGLCAAAFFVLIIIESKFESISRWALIGEGLILLFEIIFMWKLFRLPGAGARAKILWLATWAMALGFLLAGIYTNYRLHFLHLTFIAGFAMGTTAVASHVMVSHRDLNKKLLQAAWPLGVVGALWILTALTRMFAPFADYNGHLAYAGVTGLVAILIWGYGFLLPSK